MLFRFCLIIFVVMAGLSQFKGQAMAIEQPNYTVEQKYGKVEIRTYPPMLLAEVSVSGDRDTAANRGFRKLANFIFGDNVSAKEGSTKIAMTAPVMQTPKKRESEKIAMTSPVVQKPQDTEAGLSQDGQWTINFMMPSEYSMETLPKPTDSDIRIYMSEPYRTVSLRFSGRSTVKNIAKHELRLKEWIGEQGLAVVETPEYAFYDPPFMPPMFRRNEVHFRLIDE